MNIPKEPEETGGFVIRYHEYLEEFSDAVAALRAADAGLYRWVHNPLVPDDALPQIFQQSSPLTPETIMKPAADAPLAAKMTYIGYFGLSHFLSPEAAMSRFRKICETRRKKFGEEKVADFVKQTGGWIVKVNYTAQTARLGEPDRHGHLNVFPAEGVNINELIDRDFCPINMLDYDDEP